MAFDIAAFKAFTGDHLPATHYEVLIRPPTGGGNEINLRTETISVPGVAYLSVDNYAPYGSGKLYNLPYRYNPQEIQMTHNIDKDGNIIDIFRRWANLTVDLDGNAKYGAYYYEVYAQQDGDIKVYNRQELVKTITLEKPYPINIEPIQMGWGQNDEIAKLSVSYRFASFKVS